MGKYEPPITDVIQTSTGQRLFVAEWPGKHPAFVFAPGLSSTHRNVAGVAAALAGDLRVISIDLRGRGCSTKPPAGQYGMERHAEDVLSVMDELGIESAIYARARGVPSPGRAEALMLALGEPPPEFGYYTVRDLRRLKSSSAEDPSSEAEKPHMDGSGFTTVLSPFAAVPPRSC